MIIVIASGEHGYDVACVDGAASVIVGLDRGEALGQAAAMLYAGAPQFGQHTPKSVRSVLADAQNLQFFAEALSDAARVATARRDAILATIINKETP
jgi:hypothetical protein